jgi:ribose transport system permease protein
MTDKRIRLNFGFDRFSGLYLFVLFVIVFGIWTPDTFLTTSTVKAVATQQAIPMMLALALLLPLSANTFDLSVGATVNLSTIIVTVLQTQRGWPMWPAIAAAIACTAAIGVINGFIVVKLRVSSFIATLGMATVVTAIQEIVSGDGQPSPPISSAWIKLTQTTVFGFQIVFVYMLVLAVIVWWFLSHTAAGRYLYAIGGNSEAARLSGVPVGRWTWLSLIGSATICGIAGVLYASQSGPSLTYGQALLLPAFAAVFLGSTQLKPGRFTVWGTLIAVYVLATGIEGMQQVTGVQWLNDMFNGVALIVAVAFAIWRQRRATEDKRIASSRERFGEQSVTPADTQTDGTSAMGSSP